MSFYAERLRSLLQIAARSAGTCIQNQTFWRARTDRQTVFWRVRPHASQTLAAQGSTGLPSIEYLRNVFWLDLGRERWTSVELDSIPITTSTLTVQVGKRLQRVIICGRTRRRDMSPRYCVSNVLYYSHELFDARCYHYGCTARQG